MKTIIPPKEKMSSTKIKKMNSHKDCPFFAREGGLTGRTC
jgi:hypothetical protein